MHAYTVRNCDRMGLSYQPRGMHLLTSIRGNAVHNAERARYRMNAHTHTHTCKYIPQTFMHKYIQSNMHACPMKGTRRYLNMGLAKNTKAARSRHSRLAGVFELFECKMLYRSLTQMDAAILDRGMNASHVTCACVLTYKVLKCETRSAAGWIRRSAQATICFCCSCARLRHGRARCL